MELKELLASLGGVAFAIIASFYTINHSFDNLTLGIMIIALCECCVLLADDYLLRNKLKESKANLISAEQELKSTKEKLESASVTQVIHNHNETYNNYTNNSFTVTANNDDISGKN